MNGRARISLGSGYKGTSSGEISGSGRHPKKETKARTMNWGRQLHLHQEL